MYRWCLVLLVSYCFITVFSNSLEEDFDFIDSDTDTDLRVKRDVNTKKSFIKTNQNDCTTAVCKTMTSNLLMAINHKSDACEEFQEMACGNKVQDYGFNKENFNVLKNYIDTKITLKSEKFLQDFKRFYQSCVDYKLDFNFLQNLDFIKHTAAQDMTQAFADSILTQAMPFFDIGLDIDETNETYQFVLTLPGESYVKTHTYGWSLLEQTQEECLYSCLNNIGSKTVDLNKLYEEYVTCRTDLLFKYAKNYESVMKAAQKLDINDANLKELFEIYKNNPVPTDFIRQTKNSRTFTTLTINDLNSKYGFIDWKHFFEKITLTKSFTGDEKILIAFPGHFLNIFNAFSKYDSVKLKSMIDELISLQLYQKLLLPPRPGLDRKYYCMDLGHQLMPDVISWMLYELSPPKKIFLAVYQTNKIFADLKDLLKKSFDESSLDDMSKEKFITKLDKLSLGLITAGDLNITRDNYKFVKIRENYQENLIVLLKNYRKFIYSIVGSKTTPASLLNFFVDPFYTKPKSFYTTDSIVLHPEVFKKIPSSLPEHIRLAKLGFSLAQAITQHFDITGRLFMTYGIRSNDNYYEELSKHMTEVFDKYYQKTPYSFHKSNLKFKPVSGKQFVNEMIVDNAAFKLITDYFASIKNAKGLPWIGNEFTLNQTFFIAAAQEFCDDHAEVTFMRDLIEQRNLPFQIKLQNIVSNSPLFSQAFSCVEGSSFWLDPSIIRQFPQEPEEYDDVGQGQYEN